MANAILGSGGFHHVCVKTRNWDATMRFYREGLGLHGKDFLGTSTQTCRDARLW